VDGTTKIISRTTSNQVIDAQGGRLVDNTALQRYPDTGANTDTMLRPALRALQVQKVRLQRQIAALEGALDITGRGNSDPTRHPPKGHDS
jgi:hypothetical protein